MFAPHGFISLAEIVERLSEEANVWRLATPHSDDPKPGGEFDLETFSLNDENWERHVGYLRWLLSCFLNRHEKNLFVCSQNGTALKLSEALVQRHHVYDGPFDDTKFGWKSIAEHLSDPFTFISGTGYVIDIEQGRKWLAPEEMEFIVRVVERIDKCPVCWPLPTGSFEVNWRSLCGILPLGSSVERDMSPAAVSRRILELWSKNNSLNKSQLKELAAPAQSHRQFQLAWVMAAQENPDLTRPGRRGGKS
ncbi:hypothetical protein [Meridianimarinicoccus aquatilis]|uniref:Uncharacterized protein n=1 Tax=Meridianimarinicoccus aquatilis TaxID=2552766 RepID=A0A4R6AV82_9RHOB|nr:hypothetical protein [Fluviibacterium aquatile]TDL88017.1 hypothetical protein E2L05_09725 [Fluviibacterium aquatile]